MLAVGWLGGGCRVCRMAAEGTREGRGEDTERGHGKDMARAHVVGEDMARISGQDTGRSRGGHRELARLRADDTRAKKSMLSSGAGRGGSGALQ